MTNHDIHTRMMGRILLGFLAVLILSLGVGLYYGDARTKLMGIFLCAGYMVCMMFTMWMSSLATAEETISDTIRRAADEKERHKYATSEIPASDALSYAKDKERGYEVKKQNYLAQVFRQIRNAMGEGLTKVYIGDMSYENQWAPFGLVNYLTNLGYIVRLHTPSRDHEEYIREDMLEEDDHVRGVEIYWAPEREENEVERI